MVLADAQVSIITVLRIAGVDLPEDIGSARTPKVHCPFGPVYHSDGGVDPAMRVYPDTNSAYCFSCSAHYSPVSLAAQAWDLDRVSAAQRLLVRAGYRPTDPMLAWQRARDYRPALDKALMADALKTYCRRICPQWGQRQFEASVAGLLTRCLGLLDLVSDTAGVVVWLERCKVVMSQALHTPGSSFSPNEQVQLSVVNTDDRQ